MKTKTELEKANDFTFNLNVKLGDIDHSLEWVDNGKHLQIRNFDSDNSLHIEVSEINKLIKALNKFKEINNL